MNKYFKKVLEVLKTRKEIKALGFSRKEVKGIAAKIADKLDLEEDASEEDVTKAVDDEIDSALSMLQFAQTVADRRIQEYRNAHPNLDDDDDDNDDDDDDPDFSSSHNSPSAKKGKGKGKNQSAVEKMLGELNATISGLKTEISELKQGNTANSRKAKLEALVKDTGKFGERTLKSFARMSFKDDEEFEAFLDEVQEDLDAENKERAEKGLDKLGTPPAVRSKGVDVVKQEDELMSDDEVKELAKA
jgi:hypothetical protein